MLERLKKQLAELLEKRAAAHATMERSASVAVDENRDMTEDEVREFDAAKAEVKAFDEQRAALEERIGELEEIERRTAEIANRPEIHYVRRENPVDVLEDRSATPTQLADAVTRSIEARVGDGARTAEIRRVVQRHVGSGTVGREWARNLLARSTDLYAQAFVKLMRGDGYLLTDEERAAVAVGTNSQGGYLVPTHLDPTIILTNDGVSNVIRGLSRQVSLVGANTWNGVTSAGVSGSWDAELSEVSDDSPTFGNASIPTYTARAFVQASIEAFDDIAGLTGDVAMLLADARDRLEAAAHATGSGSGQPTGIFTALNANTNVQITSTTAAAIGLVDIDAVYTALPVRWRGRSRWLMNPKYSLAIKDLGTAVSASFSGDITQAPTGVLLGRPVTESDEAPNTQTTTAKDNEIILGDFSNFVIVDKPGSAALEFIPQLFGTTNGLPVGAKGWFMHWRNGSDSVNDKAFRMLVDKTSA